MSIRTLLRPIISERDTARIRELTADGALRDVDEIPGVVRLPLTGAPGSLSLGSADLVLTGIPRASTHHGGRIAFGPDGHDLLLRLPLERG